jgi:hypothetical protein
MKGNKIIALLLAVLVLAGLAGCKQSPAPTPGPSSEPLTSLSPGQLPETSQEPSEIPASETPAEPSETPGASEAPAAETMDVVVYYLKSTSQDIYLVREVHTLPKSESVAQAALQELISGTPTTEGAYRVLPADTKILGITIKDGLATVDFSKDVLYANVGASGEELGIDSVVNTLTEFPMIEQVAFYRGGLRRKTVWIGGDMSGFMSSPFSRYLGDCPLSQASGSPLPSPGRRSPAR